MLERTEHLPAPGKWWMIPFFCFACAWSFYLTYYKIFISIQEFSHFYSSESLRISLGRLRKQAAVWCLVASSGNTPRPYEIYFYILGIKLRGDYGSDLKDKATSNPKILH